MTEQCYLYHQAATASVGAGDTLTLTFGTYGDFFGAAPVDEAGFAGAALINYDLRSFGDAFGYPAIATITFPGSTNPGGLTGPFPLQSLEMLDNSLLTTGSLYGATAPATPLIVTFTFVTSTDVTGSGNTVMPIATDIFGFGFVDDGVESAERVASQIIRLELEETGDNTSVFEGTLEYTMINQLNILDAATYTGLSTIADDPNFIVIEDLTDEDSPRVNYLDLGADGVSTQVSDQEEAPSHSGVVSFDNDSYKIADTVTITLEDADLNVDTDLIDIFTVVSNTDTLGFNEPARDKAGAANLPVFGGQALGRLLDVTFDDSDWELSETCTVTGGADSGLGASGFSLIETESASGTFIGDFQIPTNWCQEGDTLPQTTTGLDIEVNYVDFRDASGEIIEVGDSAGVRANTGSVSLDRTVYPVPFGIPDNFGDVSGDTSPDNRSIFAVHATAIATDGNSNDADDLTVFW